MKKLLLTAVALALSGNAFAIDKGGVFIEPMVTYESGDDGDVNFPSPINNSETDIEGFGAGFRFGFHILESVFLGADGRYSVPEFKDSSLNQDTDAKAWNYGPVLGVQMPTTLGIRLWGSYIYDATLDPDRDRNVNEKFKDGSGWRAGAGIKLGIASLNLEYQDIKYDTTELEEVGVFTPGSTFTNVTLDNQSWILSVSFPMSM